MTRQRTSFVTIFSLLPAAPMATNKMSTLMVATMIAITLTTLPTTVGASFVGYCDLEKESLIPVAMDPTTGAYRFLDPTTATSVTDTDGTLSTQPPPPPPTGQGRRRQQQELQEQQSSESSSSSSLSSWLRRPGTGRWKTGNGNRASGSISPTNSERHLRQQQHQNHVQSAIRFTPRALQDGTITNESNTTIRSDNNANSTKQWVTFQVRRCSCTEETANYFCPMPFPHCGIRAETTDGPPGCVFNDRKTRFIRFSWICSLLCYLALFVYLVGTFSGRSILDYVMNKCFPNWNKWVAERIQQLDPERATFLITRYARIRRQQIEQRYLEIMATRTEGGIRAANLRSAHVFGIGGALPPINTTDTNDNNAANKPVALHLRTKVMCASPDGDENDITCAICFVPVEDGETIGRLDCQHVFHVSCLKTWLRRRNVCPLCNQPAAESVFGQNRPKRITNTSSSSSSGASNSGDSLESGDGRDSERTNGGE